MKTLFIFTCVLGVAIAQGQNKDQEQGEKFNETNTCICGQDYKPVCVQSGISYSSACEAECKKEIVQCEGVCPCSGSPSNVPNQRQTACPAIIRNVCGENGTTFNNECEAKNNGVKVQCEGECPCDDSCPSCCTNPSSECQGKRVDCSRCINRK